MIVHYSQLTPEYIQAGTNHRVLALPYKIILTLVFDGFKILPNENIDFLKSKNEGSYSNRGQRCISGTALIDVKLSIIYVS